ncbi:MULTISPECIES: EthD domain-containing protein [Sphingomonadales]|nr:MULTISPECIES: EthD domain-containing protein [Sphingobium]BAF30441.1 hypothetical protein [uncultured bacterium]
MSAIRMMAVFARRVGMTPQAFHDHWRYPHGSLGQGIRIIKRYVQSHQVDVDFLDADQNRYEGIAEVWFDSEADAAAFVTDPDYVAYALKDEPNFVDMDNFFAVFAREEVLKSRAEALRGDEAAYNWSIDRRPNFAKLTQVVFEEGGTAWAGDDDFALGERLGAFRHTRCHPIEKLVLPGPSVIGVRELYWPTRTLAEQGIAAAGDAFHALFSRAPKAQTIFSISERYV